MYSTVGWLTCGYTWLMLFELYKCWEPWKFWLPLLMPYACHLLVWCLLISWSGCFDGVSVLRDHESTLVFNGKTVFRVILYMRAEKKVPKWNAALKHPYECMKTVLWACWIILSNPINPTYGRKQRKSKQILGSFRQPVPAKDKTRWDS